MKNQLLQTPLWSSYRRLSEDDSLDEMKNLKGAESKKGALLRAALWTFLALLFAGVSFYYGTKVGCTPQSSNSFVPFIPFLSEPIKFHQLKEWSGPSFESDALWEEVLNNSEHRFVHIQDPSKLNIPLGMTKLGDTDGVKHGYFYSIGMHHQLHCLAVIRNLVYHPSLVPNVSGAATLASRSGVKISYDWFHIGHCFSYIKQAIMCAGDATLEYPTAEKRPGQSGVDGWGVLRHECRNIGVLDAFIDENGADLA